MELASGQRNNKGIHLSMTSFTSIARIKVVLDHVEPTVMLYYFKFDHTLNWFCANFDRLQIVAIGAQRFLGIGAAIGVIEERLGHLSHMALPQILDAGDVFHGRSRSFLYLPP